MKAVLITAAVLVVSAAGIAIARRAQPTAPTGDTAVIESYTLRAEQGALIVGPYSRFQWHHPGPIYFYALAPFYRAAGNRTTGLFAGAFAINLIAVAIAGSVVAAFADPIFAAVALATSVVYVLRVPQLLTSAWNPHIVVLATMTLAVTAAAAARVWLLPIVMLGASFVMQTHVALSPVALALAVGAVTISVSASRSEPAARSLRRAVAVSIVLLAVAWFLPALEQARRTPGNFVELWRFFVTRKSIGQPFHASFAVWSDMLAGIARPDFYLAHGWVFKRSRSSWTQAWALAQAAGLVVLLVAAVRRRDYFLAPLAALLLAAAGVSLWSVTRVEGDLIDHEVFWISALGALNAAVVLGAVVHEILRTKRVIGTMELAAAYAAMFAVVVAVGLFQLQRAAAESAAPSREAAAITQVASDLREYFRAHGVERPLVKVEQDSWALAAGVLLQLQKAGVSYAVDDDWLPMFEGARRTGNEQLAVSISGAARHYLLQGQPGTAPIAERDPVFADVVRLKSDTTY